MMVTRMLMARSMVISLWHSEGFQTGQLFQALQQGGRYSRLVAIRSLLLVVFPSTLPLGVVFADHGDCLVRAGHTLRYRHVFGVRQRRIEGQHGRSSPLDKS